MSLSVDVGASFADDAVTFRVDVDLSVAEGETLVVLGPSGSGKTLLLETVAGFHDHDGRVTLQGRDLTPLAPEDRDLGFVFQDYALFPHLSVVENVAFGTRYRRSATDPGELLADLGIDDLADRDPTTLSGGEKQRVALARALAVDPAALLLDEPLSALDVPTRQSLRDDLADVLAEKTALYVTHNRATARSLGDRIAVVRDGRVVQVGTPADVFERPRSPFVAAFTGANCLRIDRLPFDPAVEGSPERVAIRPEYVRIGVPDPDATGVVERVVREDAAFRVTVHLGDATVDAYVDDPPTAGQSVGVSFPGDRTVGLPAGGTGAGR